MPRLSAIPSRWWPAGLLLLTLMACHDAPRNNPFDPELTPAVELEVALDDTAGTVTLTWTPYEGEQAFAEYWVLRNVAKSTEVDTLDEITEAGQTSYVDASLEPNTAYVYRISVVNASGFEVFSDEKNIAGYTVTAVTLLEALVDPQAGAVRLIWSSFTGPDFQAYRVHRHQVGTDTEEEPHQTTNPGDTTFTDQTARADVDYLYTMVVEAADQELVSNSLERRLTLPPVQIQRLDPDANTASAIIDS